MRHEQNLKPAVARVVDTGDELHIPMWWNPWRDGEGTRPITHDPQEWAAKVAARLHTRPAAGRVALALVGQLPDGAGVVSLSGIRASAHVSRQVIADTLAALQRAGLLEMRSGIPVDGRDVRLIGA